MFGCRVRVKRLNWRKRERQTDRQDDKERDREIETD